MWQVVVGGTVTDCLTKCTIAVMTGEEVGHTNWNDSTSQVDNVYEADGVGGACRHFWRKIRRQDVSGFYNPRAQR